MSKADDIACPLCGAELTMAHILTSEESQRAFAGMAATAIPLGATVLRYLALFTPPKTRLTIPKQAKLIQQLLPDLQRRAITFNGREWQAPLAAWEQAIDQMLAQRDAGRLELPMSNHKYLYRVLAGMADKHEARAETQVEVDRRAPPRQDTVQVRGQTMTIGDALDAVHGNRDPALAKMDRDAKVAAPVPAHVREFRERLKKGD